MAFAKGLRRPVNAPRGSDVVAGAVASVIFFAPLVAIGYTASVVYLAPAQWDWALFIFVCSFVVALVTGFLVAMVWGVPTAALLARLLQRTTNWRLHLLGYAILGALTGFLAWTIGGRASGMNSSPEFLTIDQLPWIAATMAISGVSTAAGWLSVWRCSSRATAPSSER